MRIIHRLTLAILLILGSFVNPAWAGQSEERLNYYASGKGYPDAARERTKAFQNYKFGMMVHWGLYSIAAGKWKDTILEHKYSEWLQYGMDLSIAEYKTLMGEFNPRGFDADEWMRLVKDTGMKYFVITAKHHDGFSLYDSAVDEYDVAATPFQRDPLAELKKSADKYGIAFGLYYSHSHEWFHPHGDILKKPDEKRRVFHPSLPDGFVPNIDRFLIEKSIPQIVELMVRYKPFMFWFDTPISMSPERSFAIGRIVRAIDPNTVISSRLVIGSGSIMKILKGEELTPRMEITGDVPNQWYPGYENIIDFLEMRDKRLPEQIINVPFETSDSVSSSYAHRAYGKNEYHSGKELVERMVRVIGRGGNYLLNVGPDGEGRIPPPTKRLLRFMGNWMKINGSAIYDTVGAPFGTIQEWGEMTYNPKTKMLYLLVINTPENKQLKIVGLKSKILSAKILGTRTNIKTKQRGGSASIRLGKQFETDENVKVIALQLQKPLAVRK